MTLLLHFQTISWKRDSSDSNDQERRYHREHAPIEIITVPASEDEREDSGEDVPALTAAEVSEESGDEGDGDPEKEEPEKGEPRKGDQGADKEEVPNSEDEVDEFTQVWGKPGLQPEQGQIDIETENWV